MSDDYARRSYGEIPVGTGEKPGIVVVDFQLGFTDAQYPLGGAPLVMRAVESGRGAKGLLAELGMLRSLPTGAELQLASKPKPAVKERSSPAPEAAPAKKKLGYLEAREWEAMECRIVTAEEELEAARAAMQAPDVVSDPVKLQDCYARMQQAEAAVEALYARWAELESKQA